MGEFSFQVAEQEASHSRPARKCAWVGWGAAKWVSTCPEIRVAVTGTHLLEPIQREELQVLGHEGAEARCRIRFQEMSLGTPKKGL